MEGTQAPRILVVDDDPATRVLCKRILLDMVPPGIAVDMAACAEDATQMLRHRDYAVVLSDYHLMWMNGIDLLEVARREQPGCLRLLMTGRADVELVQEALNRARIDGFIRKPPTVHEMRQVLSTFLVAGA